MIYYMMTTAKGRSGCANVSWKKAEAETKKEAKAKAGGRVVWCYTEEELKEHMSELSAKQVVERAWWA